MGTGHHLNTNAVLILLRANPHSSKKISLNHTRVNLSMEILVQDTYLSLLMTHPPTPSQKEILALKSEEFSNIYAEEEQNYYFILYNVNL